MAEYKIDDLSEKELKFGYWWTQNQKNLKKALIIFLIVAGIFIWIWPITGLVSYIVSLQNEEQTFASLGQTSIDFASFKNKHALKPLEIVGPQIIYIGNNRYDFVAQVTNPNSRALLSLEYYFLSGEYQTDARQTLIMPGQTVFLMSLGNKSANRLNQGTLEFINQDWQNYNQFFEYNEQPITVSDIKYQRNTDGGARVSFMAENISLFNFWEVQFQSALMSAGRLVGVNEILVERFFAGEKRQIEMTYFENLPQVSRTEVVPVVDIYDKDNYFKIPGEAGDIR